MTKVRNCLRCNKEFTSVGSGNRLCVKCNALNKVNFELRHTQQSCVLVQRKSVDSAEY